MDIRKIDERLSVSPQLRPDEVAAAKAAGFRTVICNRPDGEAADQPCHQELAQAAAAEGLAFLYLPVIPGALEDETARAFHTALTDLPGPVLAYCRSGTRSAMLWALSEAGDSPMSEILGKARAAGYDLDGMASRIADGGRAPVD